jgi:hypothetical protein
MPRADRGPNARKALTILLSDGERQEIQDALDVENAERGLDLGLGSKLRELGLLWARARQKESRAKPVKLSRPPSRAK